MFRRKKSEGVAVAAQSGSTPGHAGSTGSTGGQVSGDRAGGKGRPTPTRREAEAAARARAKGPQSRKEAAKLLRERRAAENVKMRQGLKTGDERYLPARDQGKVRRFVRDFVDSRLCMAELLLPILLVIMVLTYSGNPTLQGYGNGLWSAILLLVVVDTGYLIWKIKREVRTRFPDESTKGVAFYAVLRTLQLRFMRMPKPNVKLGQKPPARY